MSDFNATIIIITKFELFMLTAMISLSTTVKWPVLH